MLTTGNYTHILILYRNLLVNSHACLITGRELEEIAKQQDRKEQLLQREKQEREQARKRKFEEQLKVLMKMKEQIEGI